MTSTLEIDKRVLASLFLGPAERGILCRSNTKNIGAALKIAALGEEETE